MSFLRLSLVVVATALVSACSLGEAFVDRNYVATSVRKQKLPGYDGYLTVCFASDTPRAERDRLAGDACKVFGLEPILISEQRWQCRLTVPHAATYGCVDPTMRFANGGYVNPFSPRQVEKWETEQAAPQATE